MISNSAWVSDSQFYKTNDCIFHYNKGKKKYFKYVYNYSNMCLSTAYQ